MYCIKFGILPLNPALLSFPTPEEVELVANDGETLLLANDGETELTS